MSEREQRREDSIEQTLRLSEAQLRIFVEYAPVAVAMFDREMRYIGASRRWISDFRLHDRELIGQSHYEIFPGILSRPDWIAVHQRCLAGAVERSEEDRFVHPDGRVEWLRWEVRPWPDPQGGIGGIIIFSETITERKQTEETLRLSEERLRLALEVAHLATWDWDITTGRIVWNNEHFTMLGYEPGSVTPSYRMWLDRVHPDDAAATEATLRQTVEHGRFYRAEFRTRWPNGTIRHIESVGQVDRDDTGRAIRCYGAMRDITERKRAEEEKDRFVTLANGSLEFIAMCDPEFNPFYVNPAGLQLVGMDSLAAACRLKVPEYFFPEDRAFMTEEFFPRVMREGHAEIEIRFRHFQTGEAIWMLSNVFSMRDAAGELVGWATVSRNITERKLAEQALRESQQFLQSISEASPHWIYIFDFDKMGTTFANRSIIQELGYPPDPEGPIDQISVFQEYMPPEELPHLARVIEEWQVLPDRQLRIDEYVLRHADGSLRWFIGRELVFSRRPDGSVRQILGSLSDITARKLAGEALRKERDFSNALIESLPGNFYLFDATGHLLRWNKQAEVVSGYSHEEIAAMHPLDFLAPEYRPEVGEKIREAFALGEKVTVEAEMLAKDGSRTHYLYTGLPIPVKGAPCLVGLGIDITERKRAEVALQQAHDELETRVHERTAQLATANESLTQSNMELQQFAYIASHDLQTPLRAISGFAQLLQQQQQGKLGEKADHQIQVIVDSVKRMQTLINDLLSYARVESNPRPFAPTDMNAVFQDVVNLLGPVVADTKGTITRDELPTILGDRGQMVQLLQNLISNGLKFHDSEPPLVHVLARRTKAGWTFSVRDNGIGIAPQHHERIFEIFRRLHTQQEYPGTGIGLAVCRRVVHRHGGRIWLESESGKGTTFFFSIPDSGGEKP